MGAGFLASSFLNAIIQWIYRTRNEDPLVPDIAYYALGFVAEVGIPLGAALFAVSFIAATVKGEASIGE